MLLIVTKMPEILPGTYVCKELSPNEAASLINDHQLAETIAPYIFHNLAKRALKELTGINFAMVQNAEMPQPQDGDLFLHVKVKTKVSPGRPTIEDLAYFKIDFSS